MVDVNTNAVSKAGAQLKAAADGVRGLNPEDRLAAIATAMPSSDSATAATALKADWKAGFDVWHGDATDQSEALTLAAADYETTDHNQTIRHGRVPEAV